MKRILDTAVVVTIALAGFVVVTPALFAGPGQNPQVKAAIHVQAPPMTCAEVPTFTSCGDINYTLYISGDVVVIPVLFDLVNVTGAEFGLDWPAEWGSMIWTRCVGDAGTGSLINPGDWTAVSWSTCYIPAHYSIALGYGLVTATSPGWVGPIFHPQGTHLGVYDCSPPSSGGPYYDAVMSIYSAGVGMIGDDPCMPDATQPSTWGAIKALMK